MPGIQSIVRDKAGNAIASTKITVRDAGTPDFTPIFSDPGLTTPLANPFTSETNGYYAFYANSGVVDIDYEKAGFPEVTVEGVELPLVGQQDHGALAGLDDDDHLQYLPTNGSRPVTAFIDMDGRNVDNLGELRGDISEPGWPDIRLASGAGPLLILEPNGAILPANPSFQLAVGLLSIGVQIEKSGPGNLEFIDELDMGANQISNMADGVDPQDAATVSQVGAADPTITGLFRAELSAPQSVPNASVTAAAFDTFVENVGGQTFNAGAIKINVAGRWVFTTNASWTASAVGDRTGFIVRGFPSALLLGGGGAPAEAAGTTQRNLTSYAVQCAVGDEFTLNVEQTSGGNLDLRDTSGETFFSGYRIGP